MESKKITGLLIAMLSIGLIGTIFSLVLFITGVKAEATVVRVLHENKYTSVTVEYENPEDGMTYTHDFNYGKGNSDSKGDKVMIYYFRQLPDFVFTVKDFTIFYFIVVFMIPMIIIFKKKKKSALLGVMLMLCGCSAQSAGIAPVANIVSGEPSYTQKGSRISCELDEGDAISFDYTVKAEALTYY